MAYNVYSLPDCRTVLYHPDVGTANLHQCGHGKITVSAAGDPGCQRFPGLHPTLSAAVKTPIR